MKIGFSNPYKITMSNGCFEGMMGMFYGFLDGVNRRNLMIFLP